MVNADEVSLSIGLADSLLVIHALWALWMVAGFALAVAGFRWRHLWDWRTFRIMHLIAMLGTATVPIWPGGTCPLTVWEWRLRTTANFSGPAGGEPFLRHWLREVLFLDVSPVLLSIVSAAAAAFTLAVFIWHPPRKRINMRAGELSEQHLKRR